MSTNTTSSLTTPTTVKLRDHLLHALSAHPGTRELHLHALVSAPQKSGSLYPFATPRPPRAYMQNILVLLSEQPVDEHGATPSTAAGTSIPAAATNAESTTEPTPSTTTTTSGRTPRVLVTAIEATLYVLPTTLCSVLYISKVDSTGQASAPSPTALLVRSLLRFYVDLRTRPIPLEFTRHLYVHIFARAQEQYLFSASKEWPGKKPLGDIKLCAWWRRCVSRVVVDVAVDEEEKRKKKTEESSEELRMKMYYVLPGYSALEAEHALRIANSTPLPLPPHLQWVYGHPYSQADGTPLPCPPPPAVDSEDPSTKKTLYLKLNLGCFIPSFDDDPKSRFMDEIAYTTDGEIKSPQRKRPRAATASSSTSRDNDKDVLPSISATLSAHSNVPEVVITKEDKEKDKNTANNLVPLGELGKVSPDEFWERMSFRQECIAGAVTGFFTLVVSSPSPGLPPGSKPISTSASTSSSSTWSPLAPQPGQVSSQINKRIMTTLLTGVEFSTFERAAKSTETIETSIRGLCDSGVSLASAPSTMTTTSQSENLGRLPLSASDVDEGRRTPEPRNGNGSGYLDVPRTPPRRRGAPIEVSPNPFPEPVASADTYESYIYGNVVTRNPVEEKRNAEESPSKKAPVTVLAVRKKVKKRAI